MDTSYTTGTLVMKDRFPFSTFPVQGTRDTFSATVESTPFEFEYNGCQFQYEMAGQSDAPLVVLIHSEGANHHSFDAQVQTLARAFRVLAWDIRGHGKSVSDQTFSLEMAVDDLHALLAHAGYSQALFVGHCAGGIIIQHFAQRFPEAVLGAALLSCAPIQVAESAGRRFVSRLTAGLLRALPYWFVRAQMPARLAIRPEVQAYIAEAMQACGQKNFLAAWQIQALGRGEGITHPPTQPLLVALGAYDNPAWVARTTALWQQAVPDIHPVVVPGAGHALIQDNPAFSAKMLEDFLRQCVRTNRHARA